MVKKLVKHGNSLALVIDKATLAQLGIGPDTPLAISIDGQSLIVSPQSNMRLREGFRQALAKVNRRDSRALKRLAE